MNDETDFIVQDQTNTIAGFREAEQAALAAGRAMIDGAGWLRLLTQVAGRPAQTVDVVATSSLLKLSADLQRAALKLWQEMGRQGRLQAVAARATK